MKRKGIIAKIRFGVTSENEGWGPDGGQAWEGERGRCFEILELLYFLS